MNVRDLLLVFVLAGFVTPHQVSAQPKAEDGFQTLFDGKSLAG